MTIGACATSAVSRRFATSPTSRSSPSRLRHTATHLDLGHLEAIADHVTVDFELRGCPISKRQLLELLGALLAGRKPNLPGHSVCVECKAGNCLRDGLKGIPCLGPITQAGCGAICPAYNRGCTDASDPRKP